jgi:HK97 family phage portal protein
MKLISLGLTSPKASTPQPHNLATLSNLLVGTRTFSGQYVNEQTALRASAVLSCIRILSEDIAQLPLNLYRRTPRGSVLAVEHPLYRLLHDAPNSYQTSLELREGLLLDMLLHGQAFCEKQIGPNGIEAIYPLAAGCMQYRDTLQTIPDGVLRWNYSDPKTGTRTLLADDLWRVNLLSAAGTIEGRSLVLLAREAIGLALAAEEQGARLFSQGIQSDLTLSSEETLGDDEKKQLRTAFMDRHAGSSNAWMPLLLEGGLKAARIGLTAQESQYIESRQYQLSDIARIFRVPDVLLGIANGKTATFASAEQFFLSYVKHTIGPWVRRIEQTITRDLLAPSESDLYAKHDLDALLRADLQTRYNAHKVGIEAGFLTRNEARAYEDLPLLEGLDTPILQLNMGSGNSQPTSTFRSAEAMAHSLAANVAAHETRLLSDGKPRAEVYAKLAAYIANKTGLPAQLSEEYCVRRVAQTDSTEAEGLAMLKALLLTGKF